MNLKQFKDLIENSGESQIYLNEDIIYAEVVDDFCEKGDAMTINIINRKLTIDGNGHAIDKGCIMKLHNSAINFRNIHFKDNSTIYTGKSSSISFIDCKFTQSKIDNQISGHSFISGCVFKKNSRIRISGKLLLENTIFENNSTYGEHMIKSNSIIIENCSFKNNSNVLNVSNGQIKDTAFENNQNVIIIFYGFRNNHLTLENCIFKNNTTTKFAHIIQCHNSEVDINNCTFENNISNNSQIIISKESCLNLNNTTFEGENSNVIQCVGELNIHECKFKKHHEINGKSVFEVYKRESEFLKRINMS